MSGSLARQYSKPPVIPTTTSPLHNRENFVSGTGSYSTSLVGAMMWRIGGTCCPCIGESSVSTGESSGLFQIFVREILKKMSRGSDNENQQPIKRTQSEEEILKKRPQRKVISSKKHYEAELSSQSSIKKKIPENGVVQGSESKVALKVISSSAKVHRSARSNLKPRLLKTSKA